MPTKHKRKRDDDKSNFNLEPTTKAKSLPVIAPTKDFLTPRKRQKLSALDKKPKQNADDTPKTFARLMAWHRNGKKLAPARDDGRVERKKQAKEQRKAKKKKSQSNSTVTEDVSVDEPAVMGNDKTAAESTQSTLKIRPGESLSEFGIRIDQSLPLSTLPRTSQNPNSASSLPADLAALEKKSRPLTKHNKRLARMQADWRATESRLKEKEREKEDMDAEKIDEEKLLWEDVKIGKRRKGKRRVGDELVGDDPWKVLERKRAGENGAGKGREMAAGVGVGVGNVVQAPPSLVGLRKNIFKDKNEGVKFRREKAAEGGSRRVGVPRRKDELEFARLKAIEFARRSKMGAITA